VEADIAPLEHLGRTMRQHPPVEVPGLPRFTGGAVGYLGYDIVRTLESLPEAPPDDRELPDALLMVTDTLLVLDNLFNRATVIATVEIPPNASTAELRRHYEHAEARIDCWLRCLRCPRSRVPTGIGAFRRTSAVSRSTSQPETLFRPCFPAGWTFRLLIHSSRIAISAR
jgi:anthranilate/para-aminobenzoate synthase component I